MGFAGRETGGKARNCRVLRPVLARVLARSPGSKSWLEVLARTPGASPGSGYNASSMLSSIAQKDS